MYCNDYVDDKKYHYRRKIMIKVLIGIAAFALATTGQKSLAGTSQTSYSNATNHINLAHEGSATGGGCHRGVEKRKGRSMCHKHIDADCVVKTQYYHNRCKKTP